MRVSHVLQRVDAGPLLATSALQRGFPIRGFSRGSTRDLPAEAFGREARLKPARSHTTLTAHALKHVANSGAG